MKKRNDEYNGQMKEKDGQMKKKDDLIEDLKRQLEKAKNNVLEKEKYISKKEDKDSTAISNTSAQPQIMTQKASQQQIPPPKPLPVPSSVIEEVK